MGDVIDINKYRGDDDVIFIECPFCEDNPLLTPVVEERTEAMIIIALMCPCCGQDWDVYGGEVVFDEPSE